jgi:acyl transferase domain-containing protein
MTSYPDDTQIAIIGMAGRFPRARNIDEFWENLRDGVEAISFYNDEQLQALGAQRELLSDPNYVRAAAALDDVESFDAAFFGLNPREAEITDPQHRILLECAWEALEHAGYDSTTYKGPIGIFAGATFNTYLLMNVLPNSEITRSLEDVQINIGNGGDFLTSRISYKMNLRGPSYLVQSACSSSLVAVHVACQSLLNEESDMALAGGVSINVKSRTGYRYVEGSMMSPDGHCRAFDANAKGTIFGSGVGLVVLKRLEDALEDRDTIHAVIKGSAVNNDGSLKIGYTAPSVDGQARVITEALSNAGVDPSTVTYIETHGTGTQLGDPIEIQALKRGFKGGAAGKKGFCALGAVKTNIGHLDAAAGVTGLIKTVLALKHRALPPSLHFRRPNPEINFANTPFYVNTELRDWNPDGIPRRAGVSAFGVGGTNAHLILEEAPPPRQAGSSRPWQLLVLSARTGTALNQLASRVSLHLKRTSGVNVADLAYTLMVGRKPFSHRRVLICRDTDEAAMLLDEADSARVLSGSVEKCDRPVVFMFPGQGSQHVNMGLGLFSERSFRETVDSCSELLRSHLGLDLRTIIYPLKSSEEEARRQLSMTNMTQPALFVVEYALAKMWMSWGVQPVAMIGHSIGEYVAACIAGVLSLEDALMLVTVRGQMMQRLPPGAMLSAAVDQDHARTLLREGLSLAAANSHSQCVFSGRIDTINELEEQLRKAGVTCRRMQASRAFHSEMTEEVIEAFTKQVRGVALKPPVIPYISNVTGTWIRAAEAMDPAYWARHLRQTVRFAEGVRDLLKESGNILLEVGPGQILRKIVLRELDNPEPPVFSTFMRPDDQRSDLEAALETLGRLWLAGARIDSISFYASEKRSRIPLPTYPFERQRLWIDPRSQPVARIVSEENGLQRSHLSEWFYIPSWKKTLPAKDNSGLIERSQRCWIIFEDAGGVGRAVATRLKREQQDVITVVAGTSWERTWEGGYLICASKREDYEKLFREVKLRGKATYHVMHLWGICQAANAREVHSGGFERAQEVGLHSLLYIVQAMAGAGISSQICISVVSNNIRAIVYDEIILPEKTTILGACMVVPQEYTNISCKCIDVVIPRSNTRQEEQLIEQLLGESNTAAKDPVIAYRGDQRWVQTYESTPMVHDGNTGLPFKEGGTYLLTGGLSGVGLELSRFLARTAHARLVLVEGSPIPDNEVWDAWLESHGREDDVSRKIMRTRALEDQGAEVLVVSVDLSSVEQTGAVIAQAVKRFGDVHGVIHAAGVEGEKYFRAISETGARECNWHFRPKVYELIALEQALQGRHLDFCALASSISTILGGVGCAAHAAANHFLDAFTYNHNKKSSVHWITINWDSWRFEDSARHLPASGPDPAQRAMTSDEGAEAFRRIVSSGIRGQVLVSTSDLNSRVDRWVRAQPLSKSHTEKATESTPGHARPNLPNAYVAPGDQMERQMANIWQQALGIEAIGVLDNFFDLGGDSLLAVQVVAQMRKELKIEFPITSLYEGVTVRSLTSFLKSIDDLAQPILQPSQHTEREGRAHRRREYQEKQRSRKGTMGG